MTDGDAGVGTAATQTAINSAMATWTDIKCSNIPLTSVPATGDVGFVGAIVTGGALGSFVPAADVVHAGFGTIVDAILPSPIIAAAFTVFFIDGGGNPTDIDDNDKLDATLREIYYTLNFSWGINTNFSIDVETVSLHEADHGLSQAHFGKLFRTDKNGKFHFAPRAVMNAGYTGQQHNLAGTTRAGTTVTGPTGRKTKVGPSRPNSHQEDSSSLSAASRNRVSSGLIPGPPARWPQIDGITLSSALGIWPTSSSLSSGGK